MSVFKFLEAVKCKPCEINRRMCDIYGEACFDKKNVYKWAKYWFATMNLSRKDSPVKKKFQLQGHALSLPSIRQDLTQGQMPRRLDYSAKRKVEPELRLEPCWSTLVIGSLGAM